MPARRQRLYLQPHQRRSSASAGLFPLQQRRPADREATWWRWGAAAAAFLVFGWLGAAVALGPLADGLFFAWLALAAAAQAAWSRLYRPAATRPTREGA